MLSEARIKKENMMLEEAWTGNQDAINQLIAYYEPEIYKLAYRYFLPGSDYEDLIQEGRIAVYKAIRSYDSDSQVPFRYFLRMVLKRKIIDSLRLHTRQKHLPLTEAASYSGFDTIKNSNQFNCMAYESDPQVKVVDTEAMNVFLREIKSQLSPLEKSVFENYFINDHDFLDRGKMDEVSKYLGISKKTLDNTIQRIRKKSIRYWKRRMVG